MAQTHGKLFTKEEADEEFGPVIKSIEMPVAILKDSINKTSDRLMFRIVNDYVVVIDNDRKVLNPESASIDAGDVFSMFSVSLVNELLLKGKGAFVQVEQRSEVLSITYDQATLELSSPCPPYCS